MNRKGQPVKKIRPPPTPVPLLSPKLWMAADFNPDSISVPRLRTILDFNQVTDPYHRKYQQVDLFYKKVLPRIQIILAKHKGDISSVDDSELIKEIEMMQRKRPASNHSGLDSSILDTPPQTEREEPARKRIKTCN